MRFPIKMRGWQREGDSVESWAQSLSIKLIWLYIKLLAKLELMRFRTASIVWEQPFWLVQTLQYAQGISKAEKGGDVRKKGTGHPLPIMLGE